MSSPSRVSSPRIFSHRGLRMKYPENTLPALQAALQLPLEGIEFDVELSQDNALPALHQQTLMPDKSNTKLIHATRVFERAWVNEYKASDLESLDAGSWFSEQFADTKVAFLQDILELDWGDVVPQIELKDPYYWGDSSPEYERRMAESVWSVLGPYKERGKLFNIYCYNPKILQMLRGYDQDVNLLLLVWLDRKDRMRETIELAVSLGCFAIGLIEILALDSSEWVSAIQSAGLECITFPFSPAYDEPEFQNWTPQARYVAWDRLLDLNVDACITDFPSEFIQYLNEKGA